MKVILVILLEYESLETQKTYKCIEREKKRKKEDI